MNLYVLKIKGCELSPQNCWDIERGIDGLLVIGYATKKGALRAREEIREEWGVDLDIVVFEDKSKV